MNGYTIYHGPSAITFTPITAILTLRSTNSKTGNIPQLWILSADEEPHEAVKSGGDVAVCGGCRHRHARGGSCYVTLHRGPLSVYRAWKRGRYADATTPAGRLRLAHWLLAHQPRAIRLGAYGDPVAVPLPILSRLATMAADAGGTTLGYTHQWHLPRAAAYRGLLMASVDSPAERTRATAGGWRTFRVGLADEEPSGHEVHCPAVTDGSTCNACRACDGGASPAVPSVFIHAHGSHGKVNAYTRSRA